MIEERIFSHALRYPERIALVFKDQTITYQQLCTSILKVRTFLKLQGVMPGQQVALCAEKNQGFICSYFAIHLLGATTIVLDSDSSTNRIRYIESALPISFCLGKFRKAFLSVPSITYSEMDSFFYQDKVSTSVPFLEQANMVEMEAAADILFTTGTTGKPKGVILTHKNIESCVNHINAFIGNSKEDIELLALPLSHSFGLGRMRCVLTLGGTLVMSNGFTNIKRVFSLIEEYRVTGIALVPTAWKYMQSLSKDKIRDYRNQLKYIEIGSASMTLNEKMNLIELLPNTKICMHYGLTEASRSMFLNFSHLDKLGTLGKASPNVEIKILSVDGNRASAINPGEILIKGDHVCKRFLDPEETRVAFTDQGFLKTGDLGFMDTEGYVTLVGRSKEMINVGGKKVSPLEVESVINEISGVQESACIGVEDELGILGEVVKAFIVRTDINLTEESIKEYLTNFLEEFKIPKYIEWLSVLPKTDSGKIKRLNLK